MQVDLTSWHQRLYFSCFYIDPIHKGHDHSSVQVQCCKSNSTHKFCIFHVKKLEVKYGYIFQYNRNFQKKLASLCWWLIKQDYSNSFQTVKRFKQALNLNHQNYGQIPLNGLLANFSPPKLWASKIYEVQNWGQLTIFGMSSLTRNCSRSNPWL